MSWGEAGRDAEGEDRVLAVPGNVTQVGSMWLAVEPGCLLAM
jgi:hypothetical protein